MIRSACLLLMIYTGHPYDGGIIIERIDTMFKAALTLNQERDFLASGRLPPLLLFHLSSGVQALLMSRLVACNFHQLSTISVMETKMIASCVNM